MPTTSHMDARPTLRSSDGFTLIELLVVVIIIGILAAIAIPTMLGQKQAAVRAVLTSDLRNLAVLAEAHYHEHDGYDDFELSPGYLGFRRSAGVTLAAQSTLLTYCVQGTREGVVMRVRTNAGDTPSISTGPC